MALVARGTLVLIVDDELDVRESLTDALSMEGYETRSVPSCDGAWTLLNGGLRPSVILLDRWLAGMSSREFVRRLRASRHARIPVVLLSGAGSTQQDGLDVDAVLSKPSETTALVRAVDRLVGSVARNVAGASSDAPLPSR